MTGRKDRGARPRHGRGRASADQAQRLVTAGALLLLGACTAGQGPEQIGPLWSHLTGPAFEGRDAPPHAEAEFPNLGTIPPRPTVPDLAVRDALTAALAEERQRSRNPLDAEMRPADPRPAGTEGDRSMPMQAPGPAALTRAPRVNWDPVDPVAPAAQPVPAPAQPPAAPAPATQRPPAQPPAPTRTAPAAQPAPAAPALPEMDAAPPPPPPADLLTPSGPPPPPSQDLLAPRTR